MGTTVGETVLEALIFLLAEQAKRATSPGDHAKALDLTARLEGHLAEEEGSPEEETKG